MTCYTQLTTPVEGFEIAEVIRTFIAKHLGLHIRLVTDEARFSDLGADWLDRLELLMRIEDQFAGVEFMDGEADEIASVGDLICYVKDARRGQGGIGLSSVGSRIKTQGEITAPQ